MYARVSISLEDVKCSCTEGDMRLGGVAEVAGELGVSRQRASQLRGVTGFPAPVGTIAAGPIWDLDGVASWATSALRRRGGRPSKATKRRVFDGRFALEEPAIGAGGFADVYRALDLEVSSSTEDPVVAVKVLRELREEEVRRRFTRELRIVSSLSHPGVVRILASGEDDEGHLWYAMPLAKSSLADELPQFVGKEKQIVELMRQLCEALGYVHEEGVFHRDIKPANILRTRSGNWALTDFGLAREAERTTTALTSTHQGVGTWVYASPETWQGAIGAEAPADVYSLGKVLQELITGSMPVSPEPPSGVFAPVIRRATRADAQQRYQAASEFLQAVERAAAAPTKRWEAPDEVEDRLRDAIRGGEPDDASLSELIQIGLANIRAVRMVVPHLSAVGCERLWSRDPDGFRGLVERYAAHASDAPWPFEFCDVIADFCDRAVRITGDPDVLRASIGCLAEMGADHNRWHVQDVCVVLLQRVRETPDALAALEGLRDAAPSAVRWTLSDFAVRSLHPVLRQGIENEILLQLSD